MTHIHYNITSTHVNQENPGDNIEIHNPKEKPIEKIPGWMHVNPIST